MEECKDLVEKSKLYDHYAKTLNIQLPKMTDLDNLLEDLTNRFNMWNSLQNWKKLVSEWKNQKFNEINTETIKKEAES